MFRFRVAKIVLIPIYECPLNIRSGLLKKK